MTAKILKFIKKNRILYVTAVWGVVMFMAEILTGLFSGNILARFANAQDGSVLTGIIVFPISLALSFGMYVALAYILGYILRNPKPIQKRNTLKALLVFSIGDTVIRVIGLFLALLLLGSTSRAGFLGGLSLTGGLVLLLSLIWIIVWTDVIAKLNNVTWLKGCVGTFVAGVVFAIIILILGLLGVGSILSIGGLTGLAS